MTETQEKDKEKDLQFLDDTVKILREQFDTVQIFCTRHDPETGDTVGTNKGSGNWYARVGYCREWLDEEEAPGSGNE
jgi:hypothetical protein